MPGDLSFAAGEVFALVQQGRLAEAEQLCRRALAANPQRPDAWNLLGVVAFQAGQFPPAADCFARAVALRREADYISNLGMARQALGQLAEAVECYREAIALNPTSFAALDNLGSALREQGRYDEAIDLHRRALEVNPTAVECWNNLGSTYFSAQRLPEAAEAFRRLLEIAPQHAPARNNLGNALLGLGDVAGAIAHYESALALQPNLPEAHLNLAMALRRQGAWEQAVASLRRALEVRPDYFDALTCLGDILLSQGNRPAAIDCYRRAAALAPDSPAALDRLGSALRARGDLAEAEQCLRRALALDDNFAPAHCNLGTIYHAQGQLEEAVKAYRRALELAPRHTAVHTNLGQALLALGELEAGIAHFQEALKTDPHCAAAWFAWATNSPTPLEPDARAQLATLLESAALTPEDQSLLYFALAHSQDQAGEHDGAFRHAKTGGELKRQLLRQAGTPLDREQHRLFVDRTIATFTPRYFQQVRPHGVESELPIFIVGMPRSGTTLVEQILSSHRDVFGAGELDEMGALGHSIALALGGQVPFPECMAFADGQLVRQQAEAMHERLRGLAGNAWRLIDKMPLNFRYLGLIAALFPQARVIHCLRDPRDVCLSCYLHNFANPELGFTFDLGDLAAYYQEYARLMEHWRRVLPLSMYEVSYENLVHHPERVTRELVEFCGLDWDENCLSFHAAVRRVATPSLMQVRQPIYTRAVARWRHYERHLAPLLDALRHHTAAPLTCAGEMDGASVMCG